jgi:hypothetical protein
VRRNVESLFLTDEKVQFLEMISSVCVSEFLRIRSLRLHPFLIQESINLGKMGFLFAGEIGSSGNVDHRVCIKCIFCKLELEIRTFNMSTVNMTKIQEAHSLGFQTNLCKNQPGNLQLFRMCSDYDIKIPKTSAKYPMQCFKDEPLHSAMELTNNNTPHEAVCRSCVVMDDHYPNSARLISVILHPCKHTTCGFCLSKVPVSKCLVCESEVLGYSKIFF